MNDNEPNWAPLESVIPLDQCAGWMWMGRMEHDSTTIEHYKHRETRGSVNLSHGGNAWKVSHTYNDYCPPFCDLDHECVPEQALVEVQQISVEAAFEAAQVWPWSTNDKSHGTPPWQRSAVRS